VDIKTSVSHQNKREKSKGANAPEERKKRYKAFEQQFPPKRKQLMYPK
jgi:hypothetical protein